MRGYGKSKGAGRRKKASGGAKSRGLKEKPGFPSAELPGKAQPGDRSAGVYRCHAYPDSKGL